ncbi:hypothetical protein FRB99_003407 [Tulasnella sp. 403]|nr:hypothetical protein FRB99_003407 [Tulasnella sp. 403]
MATTGFQDFGKGDETRVRAGTLFNKSIFVTDGSMWKTHRMLARPYFSRDRVSDYVTFAKYADKMVNIMTHFARRGEAVDVQDLFGRFTFDTAGEFLIGADDLNTLDDPLPRAGCAKLGPMGTAIEGQHGRFATAFKDAQVELVTRAFTPLIYWTAAEFFGDRQVEPIREIDAYLLPMVKEALRKKREVRITDGEETFLEHLVGSTDDVEIIRHQLLGMLVAARDTTACLLTFACYLLSQHPEVFNTLREEVLSTVGSTEHPDHQQIKQMKYLRAVLNETLRLFPPVPVDARTSCKEAIIPSPQSRGGGVYVPKSGTEIWFSLMSIHKRKDIWGDDANEFDPGRWLGPSQEGEIAEGDPVEFMPFFAGPRVCIGQQLAYNEASFVMVRLAQAFRKFTLVQVDAAPVGSLPPESWKDAKGKRKAVEKIVPLSAVTMFAKGGTWLQMNLA